MDEQLLIVGERVSKLRKNLGLTQEKLAEQADISVQFLVQIEHGKKTMKIGTLRKLCSALSVSADYLINGTEDFQGSAEISSLLSPLSDSDRTKAVKMLSAFAKI
ncbi:MAG: helix-turn-helix transcriptional regulator, partial [Oscillospiraceae bacterium]|nr:helix-turn-helix transcriptional regulator [Oscillospiraceae bacterium]